MTDFFDYGEKFERDSAIIYKSYIDLARDMLGDNERLIFYELLFDYLFTGNVKQSDNKHINAIFKNAKTTIDNAITKFLNSKKGGAPKGNTNASKNNHKTTIKQPQNNHKTTKEQKQNNLMYNVYVNDNVNDNVSLNDNDYLLLKENKKEKNLLNFGLYDRELNKNVIAALNELQAFIIYNKIKLTDNDFNDVISFINNSKDDNDVLRYIRDIKKNINI